MDRAARDALLPAIAAGDVQAFASWLAHGEPRIRASLQRFARAVDTEAILQETLLRLWRVAPRVQLDAQGDSLARLGVQIARNLAVDHVRRTRQLASASDEPHEESEEGNFSDPLLRDVIRDCVRRLPPQPRAALDQRLASAGCEPDESLAEQLGMQLNTFLKNFGRARRFLLECLRRAGVELEGVRRRADG